MSTETEAASPASGLVETEGFVPAKDNQRLFWREFRPAPATVARAELALVHGYADHSGRYLEIARYLAGAGFGVHAVDYRGHGQADGRRGHVDHFSEYLDDLEIFFARVASRAEGRKVFAIGHSHGALILLVQAIVRPAALAGLALSNPYLKLNFAPPAYLVAASGFLSKVWPWLSVSNALKPEMFTRDEAVQARTKADLLYNRNATPRWFVESNRAQAQVIARAIEVQLPVLLQLGLADPVANSSFSREVFGRLGSADKSLREYPDMRHEIFAELGREAVFGDLRDWLNARS